MSMTYQKITIPIQFITNEQLAQLTAMMVAGGWSAFVAMGEAPGYNNHLAMDHAFLYSKASRELVEILVQRVGRNATGALLDEAGVDPAFSTIPTSDLGPITQESLLPDVMPPLGRRTIEIMERKIAPSDNDLLSDSG